MQINCILQYVFISSVADVSILEERGGPSRQKQHFFRQAQKHVVAIFFPVTLLYAFLRTAHTKPFKGSKFLEYFMFCNVMYEEIRSMHECKCAFKARQVFQG